MTVPGILSAIFDEPSSTITIVCKWRSQIVLATHREQTETNAELSRIFCLSLHRLRDQQATDQNDILDHEISSKIGI